MEGVEVEPSAEVPYGEVVPPGELDASAAPSFQPPLSGPECLTPVGGPLDPSMPALPNPLLVPVIHYEAAWESIVNIVEDYFRIAREEQVQQVGQVLTEGRIETLPQSGATLLEPHRPDSVGHFNRTLATYQTIRRVAVIHVVPAERGYQIEVIVETQMEDLPRPEHATAGRATLRYDTSLTTDDNFNPWEQTGVWFPIGRDTALEQEILARIRACLDVAPPGVVY
jgi:hypothetical protein